MRLRLASCASCTVRLFSASICSRLLSAWDEISARAVYLLSTAWGEGCSLEIEGHYFSICLMKCPQDYGRTCIISTMKKTGSNKTTSIASFYFLFTPSLAWDLKLVSFSLPANPSFSLFTSRSFELATQEIFAFTGSFSFIASTCRFSPSADYYTRWCHHKLKQPYPKWIIDF